MEPENPFKSVAFIPSDTIIFEPKDDAQKVVSEIKNNSTNLIILKWKSTRPSVFHMSPTYSIIAPGEIVKTTLTCKRIPGESFHARDRFSVVLLPIAPTSLDARSIWKNPITLEKLKIGEMHKKFIFIQYSGLHNQEWYKNDELKNSYDIHTFKKSSSEQTLQMNSEEGDAQTSKGKRTTGLFTCQYIPLSSIVGAEDVDVVTAKSRD